MCEIDGTLSTLLKTLFPNMREDTNFTISQHDDSKDGYL